MSKSRIPSMSKVFNLGHRALEELFDGIVIVQEKLDGSQISWMWDEDGNLHVRSKKTVLHDEGGNYATKGMFRAAVSHLATQAIPAPPGVIFRGEAFNSPKHNTLVYERVPQGYIVLFDVETPNGFEANIPGWANSMDVEATQEFTGVLSVLDVDELKQFVNETESVLGGAMVEGVVLKNYGKANPIDYKYPLMGKYVREAFKEKHTREFRKANPTLDDTVQAIIESLNTERRFEKAVEHLRDEGRLQVAVQDIGPLMKEVKQDVMEEEREWILDQVAKFVLPKVERGIGRGLPEWYKDQLARGEIE